MKYKSVKKASDIKLRGVNVTLEERDGSIFSITLTDYDHEVKISKDGWSGLQVLVPEKEMAKRWKVQGIVVGIEVEEMYKDKANADSRAHQLRSAPGAEISLEEVEVEANTVCDDETDIFETFE